MRDRSHPLELLRRRLCGRGPCAGRGARPWWEL